MTPLERRQQIIAELDQCFADWHRADPAAVVQLLKDLTKAQKFSVLKHIRSQYPSNIEKFNYPELDKLIRQDQLNKIAVFLLPAPAYGKHRSLLMSLRSEILAPLYNFRSKNMETLTNQIKSLSDILAVDHQLAEIGFTQSMQQLKPSIIEKSLVKSKNLAGFIAATTFLPLLLASMLWSYNSLQSGEKQVFPYQSIVLMTLIASFFSLISRYGYSLDIKNAIATPISTTAHSFKQHPFAVYSFSNLMSQVLSSSNNYSQRVALSVVGIGGSALVNKYLTPRNQQDLYRNLMISMSFSYAIQYLGNDVYRVHQNQRNQGVMVKNLEADAAGSGLTIIDKQTGNLWDAWRGNSYGKFFAVDQNSQLASINCKLVPQTARAECEVTKFEHQVLPV